MPKSFAEMEVDYERYGNQRACQDTPEDRAARVPVETRLRLATWQRRERQRQPGYVPRPVRHQD